MDKFLTRLTALSFFPQFLITFVLLALFSTAFGGYQTLQPNADSLAEHFFPAMFLAVVFVSIYRWKFRQLQEE